MQIVELNCPHCSTRLRLRDRRFVGRTIHCPDCTRPVAIVRNAAGTIEAVPAAGAQQHDVRDDAGADDPGGLLKAHDTTSAPLPRAVQPGRKTPVRIVWGLAVLIIVGLIGFALSGRSPKSSNPPNPLADNPPPSAPQNPPGQSDVSPVPPDSEPPAPQGPQSLAEWVIAYRDRHGCYPVENPLARTVPENDRLGWIAAVAADHDPSGPQPQWDRSWNDPQNSRFVRRRMEALLTLRGPAASNGFPATHYIGVAGVGADAAVLPKDHPRAGIFGLDRRTTVEDVRDGLANTLLIMGVESRPAPWAAGGSATIRALTAEPYLHGPDGFGTGQADGMFVVFADGSVRLLSKDTDPVFLRRMAAMADGLPLDAAVPGEPGDSVRPASITQSATPPAATPIVAAPAADPVADQPIEPRLAADPVTSSPPSYDVATALDQPIVRFQQSPAVPLHVLLQQLEELAGIPIELHEIDSGTAEMLLARELTLDVSDTTVGGILTELLKKVDLTYITGSEFGVHIVRPGA